MLRPGSDSLNVSTLLLASQMGMGGIERPSILHTHYVSLFAAWKQLHIKQTNKGRKPQFVRRLYGDTTLLSPYIILENNFDVLEYDVKYTQTLSYHVMSFLEKSPAVSDTCDVLTVVNSKGLHTNHCPRRQCSPVNGQIKTAHRDDSTVQWNDGHLTYRYGTVGTRSTRNSFTNAVCVAYGLQ